MTSVETTAPRVAEGRLSDLVILTRRAIKSTVGKNALSLYSIQFAQYVLPLITVPYLVRVLGPQRLGTLAFGQSLIAYFTLAVDYGFGLSATRRISAQREDIDAVNRIVSNVWMAKALLTALSLSVIVILIRLVPRFHGISTLILILFVGVVGNALFPAWLFQGLERMVPVSVINLAVRTLSALAMFALVRRPEDYLVYAALMSISALLAGVAGMGIAMRKFRVSFVLPCWADIGGCLREGWVSFLTMGAVSFYTSANALILGFLTNDLMVGYYSGAERVIPIAMSVWGPLSQAAYPRSSKLAADSKRAALRWGRQMLMVMAALGLFVSATLFIAAPLIIRVAFGPRYERSVATLRLLSPLPFLVSISNVLGIQVMFPFHRERAVLAIVAMAGAVNLTLAFALAPLWQANGMAASVVLAELFVTVSYFIYLWKSKLSPLQNIQATQGGTT